MANVERLDHEDVKEALRMANGIVSRAVSILETKYGSIAYNTVKGYLVRHPDIMAVKTEEREKLLDSLEAKANKLALVDEDPSTVRFLLGTLGRDRGYGKTVEVSGPEGGAIPIMDATSLEADIENMSEDEQELLRQLLEKRVEREKKAAGTPQ